MAKNTYKANTYKEPKSEKKKFRFRLKPAFLSDRRFHLAVGFFLMGASFFLFTAFISYLFTGRADQSVIEFSGDENLKATGLEIENWLGYAGAYLSHLFMFKWFGISAFFVPPLLFLVGFRVVFLKNLVSLLRSFNFSFFFSFWVCLLLGYVVLGMERVSSWSFLCGGIGYELAVLSHSLIGWGTFLLLVFSLVVFVIFFFDVTTLFGFNQKIKDGIQSVEQKVLNDEEEIPGDEVLEDLDEVLNKEENEIPEEEEELESWTIKNVENTPSVKETTKPNLTLDLDEEVLTKDELEIEEDFEDEDMPLEVEQGADEETLGKKVENYDPTLDLGSYKYPPVELLNEYAPSKVQVSKEELEANKDKIVETLINFKIGIASIKATIGPTVTLYEIVPEAGVKISKIKNLEDDIALSLAALGIRIIAPIPGKGTIGIEVPNKNREMVSMRSVLATDKFLKSEMELPIVLGKTISNEIYITDLAKMPHLLMAGATGQGKSVGLNVLLTSLIYKKHPSQLKFVLVDPKKVELTLFNKIERHFLAKLPGTDEAIITDTKKVIYTLNSLCMEMDNRYDLLKEAGCRNLKEYNTKFINRRLNPEKGHRFLPYIVLVIDELADLMMTAGKEVETPIARLAQLARAIGIHLVVATQRPSVNVITGIIKANFPARLSFRVTSKVDSRTILDAGGAEQLVGQGDMLLSLGSDIIRLQCAFVDTPEVDQICDFVGSQRGYESAYMLPEFAGDESGDGPADVDLSERDALFDEAARLIVLHQQGSTSLIQRKLKLGYNRAGRLIDQLEAAGVVGAFEGSKAREVLIQDEYSLEQLLNSLNNK
jgi:DNA segregation ATPase FtsK/SpoIIIE, S-DNA-T family